MYLIYSITSRTVIKYLFLIFLNSFFANTSYEVLMQYLMNPKYFELEYLTLVSSFMYPHES